MAKSKGKKSDSDPKSEPAEIEELMADQPLEGETAEALDAMPDDPTTEDEPDATEPVKPWSDDTAETVEEVEAAEVSASEDDPADEIETDATVDDGELERATDADEPDAAESSDAEVSEPIEDAPQEDVVAGAAVPVPVQAKPRRAWPMILAGLFLAGIGYIAGRGDMVDNFLPESWRAPDEVGALRAEVSEAIEAQTGVVAALTETVEALPAPPDIAPLTGQVEEIAARVQTIEDTPPPTPIIQTQNDEVSPLNDAFQTLLERLDELENQERAYGDEFAALQDTAKAQQEQIAQLLADAKRAEEDAAAAATETRARVALGRIRAALDAGQPFASDLAAFAETGIADVPAPLQAVADKGIATLGALQVDVAEAARDALSAARTADSGSSGLGGFFERQLGVRSLEAREGDDPDAVLSRIVATMKTGALQDALTEAELLPDVAKEAMSGWLTSAQARADALTAAADLSASLPTN